MPPMKIDCVFVKPTNVYNNYDFDRSGVASPTLSNHFSLDLEVEECSPEECKPRRYSNKRLGRPNTTKVRGSDQIKKQIQLRLIQEVNQVTSVNNDQATSERPPAHNELYENQQLTRARQIPSIQDLPVFKRNFFRGYNSEQSESSFSQEINQNQLDERCTDSFNNYQNNVYSEAPENIKLVQSLKVSSKNSNNTNLSNVRNDTVRSNTQQSQNHESSRNSTQPSEDQAPAVQQMKKLTINTDQEPSAVAPAKVSPKFVKTERQIKYLGLVIEKDDEQIIEILEDSTADSDDSEQKIIYHMPSDPIKRQYVPIRDTYIKIVKSCRQLSIESFEKRGNKDFKKTCKNLIKIGKKERQQSKLVQ